MRVKGVLGYAPRKATFQGDMNPLSFKGRHPNGPAGNERRRRRRRAK